MFVSLFVFFSLFTWLRFSVADVRGPASALPLLSAPAVCGFICFTRDSAVPSGLFAAARALVFVATASSSAVALHLRCGVALLPVTDCVRSNCAFGFRLLVSYTLIDRCGPQLFVARAAKTAAGAVTDAAVGSACLRCGYNLVLTLALVQVVA